MTVYKAVQNGIIALIIASIALGAGLIGFISYEVYSNKNSSYAVSRLGSTGSEVKSIQQKLSCGIQPCYGNS